MPAGRLWLPSELGAMRLGLPAGWQPSGALLVSHNPANLNAWARVSGCPRVTGHNDTCGDCVETAAANAVQTKMAAGGDFHALGDDLPVNAYSAVTGYTPGQRATDLGTNPDTFFTWWQKNGIAGYRLNALNRLDHTDEPTIREAISLSGGVMLILALAREQQNQKLWLPAGTPGSWGMHAMWADEYDGPVTWGTTWGEPQAIDRSYFQNFVLGAYQLSILPIAS